VILFWSIAAAMLVAALAFAVLPLLVRRSAESIDHGATNLALLRRAIEDNDAELRSGVIDRSQWEKTKIEIERRALDESQAATEPPPVPTISRSPRLAALIGVLIPVMALALYLVLGDPRALTGEVAPANSAEHALGREQIEAMVARLAERLNTTPEDAEGWAMLGRSYMALARFPDAVKAYQQALRRLPTDARLLADYADALGSVKGNLAGEPEQLIARAIAADPNQPKALALAGTIAFNKQDFAKAIAHWERALANLPEESGFRNMVASALAEAREELTRSTGKPAGIAAGTGTLAADARAAANAAPAAAQSGKTVSGTVTLAPALAAQADPAATVFVFARSPEGAGPPLAILRTQVNKLPPSFTLDDTSAMNPQRTLSSAAKVIITARVSKSGNASPQAGDLEGASAPVAPSASGVAVKIDRVRGS
jgi:cytochrome c-type biogenesis protein CcmH